MNFTFIVPEDHDGRRLSDFIRGRGVSARLWKKVKWQGTVCINGEPCHHAKTRLHAGDKVTASWEEENDIVPAHIPISVIYEDEWLLLVNKGPHMIIHPTSKEHYDTLVNAVAGYLEEKGEAAGVHPIYRLDRNTTGLVLVAKSSKVQHDLSKSHDRIYREYVALASGVFPEKEAVLNKMVIRQLMDTLDETEQQIIRLRYFENKTQCEVAGILAVTQVQISRNERKILAKLRAKLEL